MWFTNAAPYTYSLSSKMTYSVVFSIINLAWFILQKHSSISNIHSINSNANANNLIKKGLQGFTLTNPWQLKMCSFKKQL
jgi:hypothetical protein